MEFRERLTKLAFNLMGATAKPSILGRAVDFIDSAPSYALGAPFAAPAFLKKKGIVRDGDFFGRILAGKKQRSGPFAGTRQRMLTGPDSMRAISMERYNAIKEGKTPGLVALVKGIPMERKTGHGGLLGIAQAHPFITSAGIAAAVLPKESMGGTIASFASPQGVVDMATGTAGIAQNTQLTNKTQGIINAPVAGNNVFARGPDPRFHKRDYRQWSSYEPEPNINSATAPAEVG